MAHLITLLLFIGFFSPACKVTAVSANKKSNEHFISLRDYDFVGEDPRLKAALAERMKVLQAEVDLSDLDTPRRGGRAPASSDIHRPPPAYQPKPDYLHSSLNFPQMVNVSLDYAELYNASELFPEGNASWHLPDPAPGARLRGDTNPYPGPGGRRQIHKDPSVLQYNNKTLDLMKQMIYGTQLKILELGPLIRKYEPDPRFRMAYIFNRVDEWLRNLRTAYRSTVTQTHRRVKRIIWYYEHSLRINIDITYSIEHLVFLHNEYMKNMEALVPMKKRQEMREKKMKKNKAKKKDKEKRKNKDRK